MVHYPSGHEHLHPQRRLQLENYVLVWIIMKSINGRLLIKMCSPPGKWHLWSKWMRFNLCPQLSNLKLNGNKASKGKLEPFCHRTAHSPHYSHPASPSNVVIQSLLTGLSQMRITHNASFTPPGYRRRYYWLLARPRCPGSELPSWS